MADAPNVSGPGSLSRRTDKGPAQKIRDLPDAQYGEAATYKDLQHSAPLAQQAGTAAAAAPRPRVSTKAVRHGTAAVPDGIIPLTAPSSRPGEPTTAGAAVGAGPGMEALGIQPPGVQSWQTARDMLSNLAARNPNDAAVAYLMARLQGRY